MSRSTNSRKGATHNKGGRHHMCHGGKCSHCLRNFTHSDDQRMGLAKKRNKTPTKRVPIEPPTDSEADA